MMLEPTSSVTSVPAAGRTLAVFEVFAREKRELLKSEMARLLDLPESSCSDLLNTLLELGYVSRTVNTKRFYPTGRLIDIAKQITEHDELLTFGTEATTLLSERLGETCVFGELEESEVRIVAVSEGTHRLRYVTLPGDRVSIHGTAIGKALLAGLPGPERDRLLRLKPLRALTDSTKVTPEQVEKEIKTHSKLGWYQAVSEGREGVSSFAVHGLIGPRLVGFGLVGPSERFAMNKERYVKQLKDAEAVIFGLGNAASGAGQEQAASPRRRTGGRKVG
jgi:DNA-binding IclR family transcriptional regulator